MKQNNPKYKVLKKTDLKKDDIKVYIDGIDTTKMSLKKLNEEFKDYKTFEIYQYSYRRKKWLPKIACENTKKHELGINKECMYLQVPLRLFGKPGSIPLHRLVYVWFNGQIKPYNKNGELMDICHIDRDSKNNHISNLKWDTRKNNLAERTGAINQYGIRKRDR